MSTIFNGEFECSAAEYSLTAAIVCLVIIAAITALRQYMSGVTISTITGALLTVGHGQAPACHAAAQPAAQNVSAAGDSITWPTITIAAAAAGRASNVIKFGNLKGLYRHG